MKHFHYSNYGMAAHFWQRSYEPQRISAYSEDMKWRMVWQTEAPGLQYSDVAANLGVDSATVCRTVTRFRESGTVQKRNIRPQELTTS